MEIRTYNRELEAQAESRKALEDNGQNPLIETDMNGGSGQQHSKVCLRVHLSRNGTVHLPGGGNLLGCVLLPSRAQLIPCYTACG